MKYPKYNDVASDNFIGKLPAWLRWMLFLPAAVVSSVVGSTLFIVVVSFFAKIEPGSLNGGWYRLVQSAILGIVFVYVGAFIAPRAQLSVAVILLVLLTILMTLSFSVVILSGGYNNTNAWYVGVHALSSMLGGGGAMYSLYDSGAEFISTPIVTTSTNEGGATRGLVASQGKKENDELESWDELN